MPSFSAVSSICAGATLSPLPTTSTNNIAGSWSPALNNTVTTTYTFTPLAGQCATTSALTITVGCSSTLNLKLFIEGYYDTTTGAMSSVKNNQDGVSPLTDVEDLTVELHTATAPYGLVATTIGVLKTTGTLQAMFNNVTNGSYYIVVKGINLLQTWSAAPQTLGAIPLSYDFSNAASQAYGSNMIEMEPGVFAMYQGQLVVDDLVDQQDFTVWEGSYLSGDFGIQPSDLRSW